MTIRAAIIGCGKRGSTFAEACSAAGKDVELVAFADPIDGLAAKLAEQFGGKAYTDTAAMLDEAAPDFTCLVTRPRVRLEPIRLCAEAGVKAMLSEKPMATSWGEAKAIHQAARDAGMKLSFCHQRRVNPQYVEARRLIEAGALGELKHIIGHCADLYDWGTHWYDMMHWFNGEVEADRVLAQAKRTCPLRLIFDVPMDVYGVSVVHFANGVSGTVQSGAAMAEGCMIRAIGTEGTLTVSDGDACTLYNADGKTVRTFEKSGGNKPVWVGVAHVLEALRRGQPSQLDSANALRATQLVFAAYQSALIGDQVDLPLPDDFDLSLTDIFGEVEPVAAQPRK